MARYQIVEIYLDEGIPRTPMYIEDATDFKDALFQYYEGQVALEDFNELKIAGNVAVDKFDEMLYVISKLD